MLLEKFDPPGFLEDFNEEQRAAWHDYMNRSMDSAREGYQEYYDFDGPREQFYNAVKVEADDDVQTLDINWTAFPRIVQSNSVSDTQRWRKADSSRDLQDEYCEWSVERDNDSDKITRVTFTCEAPEYWSFLANTTPDKALELYQKYISEKVKMSDLFLPNGKYNPRNKWNSTTVEGAMHLIQRNNTLGAEIELAAGASVVRIIDGQLLTNEQELILCGSYGAPERHSDPHIGAMVNSLTRQKADVTLENPVGLYLGGLDTADWETPDNTDAQTFWKYLRGRDGKFVRAVYEVPPEHGYTVGDIKIRGKEIKYGGQISDFINIKLTGVATRFGKSTVAPMTACRREKEAAPTELAEMYDFRVEMFIDNEWGRGR